MLRERETIGPCLVGGGNCSSMTVGIELGRDLKSVDTIRGSSPGTLRGDDDDDGLDGDGGLTN